MDTQDTAVPTLISATEAAALAGVSREHIYRLVRRGTVEAVRVGADGTGPLRIDKAHFLTWLHGPEPAA